MTTAKTIEEAQATMPEFHRVSLEKMLKSHEFSIRQVVMAMPGTFTDPMGAGLKPEYRALKNIDGHSYSQLPQSVRAAIPGLIEVVTGVKDLHVPRADQTLDNTNTALAAVD